MHAVSGRTGDTPSLGIQFLDADRQVKGQRIAGAGTVTVRCDHQHVVAGGTQAFCKDANAGGIHTVVVTYQDSQ